MIRKTYAARGLLDFQMAINVGGAILRILFSGGMMGANGVISAKYTTDNEALHQIIENSDQFKKGRIYLFETIVMKDPKNGRNAKNVKDPKDDENNR